MTILKKIFQKKASPSASDEHNYYKQAKSWYEEKYELIEASLNRYRLIALCLGALLALSLISISVMMPLKQYTYRMITLNQTTGEVVNLKEITDDAYSANWSVTRFFINQYILNRNLFNYDDYLRTYNSALALSDTANAQELHNSFIVANPESPLNVLKKDHYRDVIVLSINQLNSNTAIVRFKTKIHSKSDANDVKSDEMQAVVKWRYASPPADLDYRDINPLGFYVTYYQVSPVIGGTGNE